MGTQTEGLQCLGYSERREGGTAGTTTLDLTTGNIHLVSSYLSSSQI